LLSSSARITSASFTLIDLVCILMTFLQDYSTAPKIISRLNETFKYTSIVVWIFLLYARYVGKRTNFGSFLSFSSPIKISAQIIRYTFTEDAIERMTWIIEVGGP